MKEPLPAEAKKSGDSFEDTMLLLDIVRERKKKQNENKKVKITLFLYYMQRKKLYNFIVSSGRDDTGDGNGAEKEETNEGEFLYSSTRNLQHQPCSMNPLINLLPINVVCFCAVTIW